MARTKNDKRYEEEAEQFRIFRQANIGLSLEGLIVDAFRWYDARRERETCEYRQFLDGNALCNRIVEKQARERMAHICTTEDIDESCGQDIIEKEGK
jgi:hypothetical protein